jgi:hypothetical protein
VPLGRFGPEGRRQKLLLAGPERPQVAFSAGGEYLPCGLALQRQFPQSARKKAVKVVRWCCPFSPPGTAFPPFPPFFRRVGKNVALCAGGGSCRRASCWSAPTRGRAWRLGVFDVGTCREYGLAAACLVGCLWGTPLCRS